MQPSPKRLAAALREPDVLRPLSGSVRLMFVPAEELIELDFSRMVREGVESFRPVIDQMGKKLEESIQEGIHVRGDARMLTELVNILVDNAGKYCDDCGTVRVGLKKRSLGGAVLTVENDYKAGEGEDYSRFFQRFYRADQSHNSGKSGYGIGLSMASTIVEKLKGTIRVSWKNGVITFTLSLAGAGSSGKGKKEKQETGGKGERVIQEESRR